MAKISHDDTSWSARGVVRRDFRHSHEGGHEVDPEPEFDGWGLPRHPTSKSTKKDTKKWCKGHVGREHVIKTVPAPRFARLARPGVATFVVDKCETCDKEFRWRKNPDL